METTETEMTMDIDQRDDPDNPDDENKENIVTYVIGDEIQDFKEIISIVPIDEDKTSNPENKTTVDTPASTPASENAKTTDTADDEMDTETATPMVEPITVKSEIDNSENELVLMENVETKTSTLNTNAPKPTPLSPKKTSNNRQIRQRSSPRNTRGMAKMAKLDKSYQPKMPNIEEATEKQTSNQQEGIIKATVG